MSSDICVIKYNLLYYPYGNANPQRGILPAIFPAEIHSYIEHSKVLC